MSNEINTGGPAFPHDDQAQHYERAGMTIRDYFAAKAMQAFIERAPTGTYFGSGYPNANNSHSIAAFAMADAMIKARNNK